MKQRTWYASCFLGLSVYKLYLPVIRLVNMMGGNLVTANGNSVKHIFSTVCALLFSQNSGVVNLKLFSHLYVKIPHFMKCENTLISKKCTVYAKK